MHTSTSLHVKRLFLQRLGDSLTWRLQLFWMISDLSDVMMTVVMDSIWFVGGCNDCRDCVTVLISRPRGYVRRMRSSDPFSTMIWFYDWTVFVVRSSGFRSNLLWRTFATELPIITLECLLDDEQYLTRWINITVHYSLVICSSKYVRWYWGYFWCNYYILD